MFQRTAARKAYRPNVHTLRRNTLLVSYHKFAFYIYIYIYRLVNLRYIYINTLLSLLYMPVLFKRAVSERHSMNSFDFEGIVT